MFSVCENGKNNDAMISDWDCKAHSIAQLYIKSICCGYGAENMQEKAADAT